MVICRLPLGTYTKQCDAAQYCGSGSHLCTATEYLAHGGDAQSPPAGVSYWLAACVRQGAAAFGPADWVCAGGCAPQPAADETVEWACGSLAPRSSGDAYVGVIASTACSHVGANSPATQGQWKAHAESLDAQGAVCCE